MDSPDIHPTMYCHTCHNKARRGKEKWVDSTLEVRNWEAHEDQCSTCEFFVSKAKGGRPTKSTKNRGRPCNNSFRYIAESIDNEAPPTWMASEPLILSRFLPPASNLSLCDMQCAFCKCIVDRPVTTPCRKLVCAKCITEHIRNSKSVSLHCPSCSSTHSLETASLYGPASDMLLKIIGSLLVKCDKPDCTQIVALSQLKQHIEAGCQKGFVLYSPSKLTLGQVLSRPVTAPLIGAEKRVAGAVVKRMLHEAGQSSTDRTRRSGVLQLPTVHSVYTYSHSVSSKSPALGFQHLRPVVSQSVGEQMK